MRGLRRPRCVKERAPSVGEPVEVGGVRIAPGDQVVADSDAILVIPAADWPAVEAAACELEAREDEVRTHILKGGRLADLLELPE